MAKFEWASEGPPESRGRGHFKYRPILAEIATRPNEWARIPMSSAGGAGSLAREIKLGKKMAGKWETASRTIDGQHFTYVRYMGSD